MRKLRSMGGALLALGLALGSAVASAAGFPDKPVTLVAVSYTHLRAHET